VLGVRFVPTLRATVEEMKLEAKLSQFREPLTRLTSVARMRECASFADICWDNVDIFALQENPGILFETSSRVFVFQEINGEIRYYAGGWGSQQNIYTEPNEFGVVESLGDALAYGDQYLREGLPLDSIPTRRMRKGGTTIQ
jgi:hypothetical protein